MFINMVINARQLSTPPCPPLILEGELDSAVGIDGRSDTKRMRVACTLTDSPSKIRGG